MMPSDEPSRGTVSRLAVRLGDGVQAGQFLFELETDVVTMEVRSPYPGTVVAIHFGVGDEVPPGVDVVEVASE
jgi:pyruvate/2-oxoglutarate dehydrogenase complex dihydrolipoamide acyltransferase (E2) component